MKEKLYDLTAPQRSILVTEQYFKGSSINHICGTAFLYEKIDFDVLEQALNLLVKYNDSLRIRMVLEENEMKQTVNEYVPFNIETVEVSSKDEVSTIEANLMKEPFDMYSNLFTCKMFRMPDGSGGFSVNIHHLVSDSWTLGLVAKEVVRIYSSLIHNKEVDTSSISSYVDYIASEQEYRNSDKFKKDKAYWDSVFEDIPESASIPGSKEDADSFSCKANRLSFTISKKEMDQINAYCKDAHISAFNFFMGLYAIYTSRVSGLEDFVMGTPILNRTNFKEKNTMGMFINVVPLRLNLTENLSFGEFASRIAKSSFEMMRHQKYSYQYILEDLRKKDASLPNLYHILMSYQITKASEESGVPYDTRWAFNGNVNDDLEIHLYDLNDTGCIDIAYDYRTDKYEESEISAIHERMLHMLHQVLARKDIGIHDIEIVTSKEKYEILYGFNDTDADYPRDKTIVDLFEEQVEKTPEHVAVVFGEQHLTYRELNEKSNQLARFLIDSHGISNHSIVGIMLHRSFEMVISILAILKTGATYLPIDPEYPIERIHYMLADSGANIVLVHSSTSSYPIHSNCKKIDVTYGQELFDSISCKKINYSHPEDLIYLIYTSGSTGNPKGVMVSHRNITNFILGVKQNIDFSPNKVMLSITTICFDIFALELWGALTSGICLVLANDIEQFSPFQLKDLCIKHHVTMMQTTPSRYSTLLSAINVNDTFWDLFTDILVGGEAFPKSLLKRFHSITNANIFNLYGPTETTVWSTVKNLSNTNHITIGKPIANTTCYVLDRYKQLLPLGTPGKLYIGGVGVSSGYWNKEILTKEKFEISSYRNGEIIYNTGDLAYINKDKELVHLGRTDFQVKIRGYRIELGEIENKILTYPDIISCVVNPVENSNKLCAYYISHNPIEILELKSCLQKELPNYMVPNYFMKLVSFPYTPNGKIDRKQLPLPKIETSKNITIARNELDTGLIAMFQSLLNLDMIDLDDSLYDLGGDSLTSINLVTAIYNKFHITITVKDVFTHPTVRTLSDYLATLSISSTTSTIKRVEKRDYYPASNAQKRIYFASCIDLNSILYNIAGGVIIDKTLDFALLQKCFETLITRHEVLRTHFSIINDELVQVVENHIDFVLPFENNSSMDVDTIYANFVKPFDLHSAPLFRAKVVRLANRKTLLLLDLHHAISDGTSLAILLQELCDLYNGKVLPDKQLDYKDFSLWEKEQSLSSNYTLAKDFWMSQFQDDIPLLNMPTVFARPSLQSFDGANLHLTLPHDVFQKIHLLAKRLEVTPYMLLLSAFYVLLAKYSSQDDLVVGTPVVGRDLPELSNMLGMFVNTLPLRQRIDSSVSFANLVKEVKQHCLDCFYHQSYPFDELVKDLKVKRDPSRNPLFDVMFAYQNNGYPSIDFKGSSTEYCIPDSPISKFDLTLEIIPTDNEFLLRFEYCTKLFDEDFIKRFSSHYVRILDTILEHSDIMISSIDMLSEEEKHQLLYDFNDTYMDYPRDKTIVDLFEEQVKKTPNNIAVVFEDQSLTYRELNEKANQLAHFLIEHGVVSNSIVGIYLDKSLEVIVSMIAILKTGSAFLPLDIEYPEERLNYVIGHACPKVILSSRKLGTNLLCETIFVDLTENLYQTYKTTNLDLNYSPENLMYVMYTSGSTGNPKGVMVKHKNIVRLAGYPNFIKFSENEVMVQTGTIVFDACIFEIFGCLLHGFKLYILRKEQILDINYFTNFLEKNHVTILFLTTGLFNQLGLQNPSMFAHLKYLLTGGDVISKTSIQKILNCSPDLKLINCYGPTENGSYSTCYLIDGHEDVIPIGKPITNSTAYVVANNCLCPVGILGELWVGGDGVAKGYLNNPNLTKQQFIQNPFGEGTIYKTGDLVKWLPDGNIIFIGRIDHQVKIRGFRVELSEIDRQILLQEKNIKQSLTVVQVIHNVKTLCSYILSDIEIDFRILKDKLAKCLPVYMIPTFIIQLPCFPLNINGKVDTKSLPMPNVIDKAKDIVPARNDLDTSILVALSNILDLEKISIDDSFFDLGGDSLSAIAFTNILAQTLHITVKVSDVFKYPIIQDLSDYLATLSIPNTISTIKRAEKRDYYPVSNAQKRIYYTAYTDPGSISYNIAGGVIIDKTLDFTLLQKCFETLITRHEVLRTHFSIINDELVQVVENHIDFVLPFENNSSMDVDTIYANFVKPFDLHSAPLFRAKVVRLANRKTLLLLDLHHAISDGTSLAILLQELCDLYNGKVLPDKQLDYKDFSLWEKEQSLSSNYTLAKDFWMSQFQDDIPLLNMPTVFARPSLQSFDGANLHLTLPHDVFQKIHLLAKRLEVTPYMLLLSAFYVLLAKYSSQDDLVVGTPVVGRDLPELSNMLGMFVNTLPLRQRIDSSVSFANLVKEVKQHCLDCFYHQSYPFDELVKDLKVKRDPSRNPLFDVMFAYQNNGYPSIDFKGSSTEYCIPDSPISKFDLTLEIIPTDNEFLLRFEYCTKLFDEDFIKRFSSHYVRILDTILEHSDIMISSIDMLSEEEKHQLLYDFNDTYMDYPRDKTIVDLFEEQVKKTPNNIAVVFEDQSLTYRELNEKANQLAHFLIEHGVVSNSIVGIMLPRSLEIMIGFLGVLKAGACYIPIDPSFPSERIEYMLEHSNATLLLKIKKIKDVNFKHIFNIDLSLPTTSEYPNHNLNLSIAPEDSSYIIYTSGSTGKPKGVVLKHQSLMNLTCHLNNTVAYLNKPYINLAIASITTISFDIFLFETIISLQKGLKVIIANEQEQTNPTLLDALIAKHDVKAIQMTPSRMDVLMNNKEYMPHLSNLQYVTLAGEALPIELKNKIQTLGNIIIYNGYGPSETTVFSSFTDVSSYKKITIGKPLSNTYVYVLDQDKNLCPIGIPGELYISGEGVGKGYLNQPALTDEVFMLDSFRHNFRMYKTGDLVKWLPNGELDYIGRIDHQVKIRGLRIELGEIQKWILQYLDITNVILSSHTDSNGRLFLIAYLTVCNRISINDLKIYLSNHIPKYMIPTYFVVLDKFPYLPNGKIDKKSLPIPNQEMNSNKKYVAPTNKLEMELIQIFENLLAISPIGIHDNFFDIGGDSLVAMSLQLELLKLHINISYSDIFMFPTVNELANHISSNSKKSISKIDSNELAKFDPILQNTVNLPKMLTYTSFGNLLLTGVTGFLGAHILHSFLTNENGIAYCLIRPEPGLTIEQKLLNKLHYYFDDQYDSLVGNRIIPILSDISTTNLGLDEEILQDLICNVDVVINSAAKVSHYGNYGDYKKINIDGPQNLIEFCIKYHKRFYQISTLSVSGNSFIDDSYIQQDFDHDVEFHENNFYMGQSLDNVYIRSKFEAEKLVLNGILNGLDGYIIRVGNLMNRVLDGMFQPNVKENNYINRLLSFYQIGYIPDYLLDGYLELTPVDNCADAIIKIVQYPCEINRIFHLLNHKNIDIDYFITILNKYYNPIRIVSQETFLKAIDHILEKPNSRNMLSGLINDFDENRFLIYSSPVKIRSDFTIDYLNKIGFDWPKLGESYITKFLNFFNYLNLLNRKDGK